MPGAATTLVPPAHGQPMAMLTARRLAKIYRGRSVVNNVSLTVESGEIVGLLGPNGAGKTTSFHMIIGLVACDSGAVHLGQDELTGLPCTPAPGWASAISRRSPRSFVASRCGENVMAILETRPGLDRAGRESRLERLLDELHVSHLADHRGDRLSGGERPPGGDRAGAGGGAAVHAARRALRGHRSDIDPGHPADRQASEPTRDRRAHHRSQRAGHAPHLRPRVHRQRGDHHRRGRPGRGVLRDEHVREVYLGQDFRL